MFLSKVTVNLILGLVKLRNFIARVCQVRIKLS